MRGRVVGERAQRALHGGHGEPRARVAGARALAGATPAHHVPLAREHHATLVEKLARAGLDRGLVREAFLGRGRAARSAHEPGRDHGAMRPCLRAQAGGLAGVVGEVVWVIIMIIIEIGFGIGVGRRFVLGYFRILVLIIISIIFFGFLGRRPAHVLLHGLEQRLDGAVVHRLKARERERGRVSDRQEDDGVACGRLLELVVEQPLVEDADVLA